MTTKIHTTHIFALLLLFASLGVNPASASEVTGTLSSDTAVSSQTNGTVSGSVESVNTISGTVSGGSSSGGGGGSSSGSRGSSNTSPSGQVLGAATDSVASPGFPNAGVLPEETTSTAMALGGSLLALVAVVATILRRRTGSLV